MAQLRLLLVDDEEELVSALAERLALRGFEVTATTSSTEASRWFDEERFDIVLLDVKMPGRGGLELLAEMRKKSPDIPAILLSGCSSARDARLGMAAGAVDYVVKPLDIEELAAKIRHAVGENEEMRP